MKKIKFIPVFFVAAILCLLLIESCSDEENPITPPVELYQFDSARYDWNFQYFPQEFLTFDAFDTSNIFLLGINALVSYDGNNFHFNYYDKPHFYPLSMGSYDMNNIYIGGHDKSVKNYGMPKLLKWNSAAFKEISIPNPQDREYQISAIHAIQGNKIWLGSTRGDLIYYNGGSFEFFRVDSTFIITMFGSDETGSIYSVGSKTVFDTQTINYLNIYKKSADNWGWSLVFSETYLESQYLNEIRPSKINFNIAGFENNIIEKFTGTDFIEVFQIKPFTAYPMNKLSDSSINYFSLPGRIGSHGFELFNWNGSKWSKEIDFEEIGIYINRFNKLENVEGKYFALCSDVSKGICFFGKGIKKPIKNF
jgi:hypothetical protein